MNTLQEIILEQIEEYKQDLKIIEKLIVEKYKAGEDYSKDLEKTKFKKTQIQEAFIMFADHN